MAAASTQITRGILNVVYEVKRYTSETYVSIKFSFPEMYSSKLSHFQTPSRTEVRYDSGTLHVVIETNHRVHVLVTNVAQLKSRDKFIHNTVTIRSSVFYSILH